MSPQMVSVQQAQDLADKKLTSNLGRWAAALPAPPAFTLALHPPTEQQARKNLAATQQWVDQWRQVESQTTEVEWVSRSWPSLGTQLLPSRLCLPTAHAIAAFANVSARRQWQILFGRAHTLKTAFGDSEETAASIQRCSRRMLALSDHDFDTLVRVVDWLADNTSQGMRPRQLPIYGIDSKWFGKHRFLVETWHSVIAPGKALGIVDSDPLVRMRILDSDLTADPLKDFSAPIEQLASLAITPSLVFIVENKETMLAMPSWPGAVVIFGSGYAAGMLNRISWLANTSILYWGDLDSDGFAILNQVRSHLPQTVSVLMDEATLLDCRDLWTTDTSPNMGVFKNLNPDELQALTRLRVEGHIRLEQERIPWEKALTALRCAAQVATEGKYLIEY